MSDTIVVTTEIDELCRRLCKAMTLLELREFVEAVEDVQERGNGYGQIVVDLELRRVKLISTLSSRKPGVG